MKHNETTKNYKLQPQQIHEPKRIAVKKTLTQTKQ